MTRMKPTESILFQAPYEAPGCEILSVRAEGILCQSNWVNIQELGYDGDELWC